MKYLFLIVLLIFSSRTEANFFDLYGVGPEGMGTASAQTASAEDYRSIWYNPANLSLVKKTILNICILF